MLIIILYGCILYVEINKENNMNKQRVFEGATVYIQGTEMTVTNLRFMTINGNVCARFEGVCTDSTRNDHIRNTGYNGATYGGNHHVYDFDAPTEK